jgi:hypothetical protein
MKIVIPRNYPSAFESFNDYMGFSRKYRPVFEMPIKRVYYPGAFADFETLEFFMDFTEVNEVYFCDYWAKSEWDNIVSEFLRIMGENVSLIKVADYYPAHFGLSKWADFWHQDCSEVADIDNCSFVSEYKVKRGNRELKLYYFGTEAIGTYDVLLGLKLRMDVVVCQDHGLGGLWTSFCEGSLLHDIAKRRKFLPKYLMVGCDQNPWSGYSQCIPDFGKFGLHQLPRGLYKR